MNEIIFREVQKQRQLFIWIILITLLIIACVFDIIYPIIVSQFNKEEIALGWRIFIVGLPAIFLLFFYYSRLITEIRKDGIYVKYIPFQRKFSKIAREDIQKVYCREYKPFGEYGGWGIRVGFKGKGVAYNVSGNIGLQIILKSCKKILIGTQKPEEIEKYVNQMLKEEHL